MGDLGVAVQHLDVLEGTPSRSATIWLNAVSWPWPCALAPVTTSTLPVGSIRTLACSQPPAP